MIENILTILYVIIVSGIGASTTYFYQFLIGNPDHDQIYLRSIFSFFGVWLLDKYNENEKPVQNYIDERGGEKMLNREQQMKVAKNVNWTKMLGICIFCTNVYITAIVTGIIYFFTSVSLWWILPSLVISNLTLNWIEQRF
jgi:hypothetical protein